jgi:hypothetical protein
MNRFAEGLLAAAIGLLASPGVFAAESDELIGTLQDVEGTVLIKQGEESVPAVEGQQVLESQEILVTEGAKAMLVFNDGCDISLDPEELYRVPGHSPCATLWWAAPAAAGVICAGAHASNGNNSRNIAAAGLLVGGVLASVGHNRESGNYKEFLGALEQSEGEVMVAEDGGPESAIQPGTRLKAGQHLMVKEGGKAMVRFDDGCTKEIKADSGDTNYSIPHNSPCFRSGTWWASAAAATALCVTAEDSNDTASP